MANTPTIDEQAQSARYAEMAKKAEQKLRDQEKNSQQTYVQTLCDFAIKQVEEVKQQMQQTFIGEMVSLLKKLPADQLLAAKNLVDAIPGTSEQIKEIKGVVDTGISQAATKTAAEEKKVAEAQAKQRQEEQEKQRQEEKKRQEQEKQRQEEERKRQEEEARKAEEERKKQGNEAQPSASNTPTLKPKGP